jgi:hypothetical protein
VPKLFFTDAKRRYDSHACDDNAGSVVHGRALKTACLPESLISCVLTKNTFCLKARERETHGKTEAFAAEKIVAFNRHFLHRC